jgi:hypothetical protein
MLRDSHPALPNAIDHFGLGHLAEQRGQPALAREHLTQALRQDATLAAPVNALFARMFWAGGTTLANPRALQIASRAEFHSQLRLEMNFLEDTKPECVFSRQPTVGTPRMPSRCSRASESMATRRPGANARYFEALFKQRRFVSMRI